MDLFVGCLFGIGASRPKKWPVLPVSNTLVLLEAGGPSAADETCISFSLLVVTVALLQQGVFEFKSTVLLAQGSPPSQLRGL